MKVTENLTAYILFEGIFVVQDAIRSRNYNITPLHDKQKEQP